MDAEQQESVYESLLSIAEFDPDVLWMLRAIAAGDMDVDDLVARYDGEHIRNGASRIEARVYEDKPGVWVADPKVGLSGPREFATENGARAWIIGGGHYAKGVE